MSEALRHVGSDQLLAELGRRMLAQPSQVPDEQIITWVAVVAKLYSMAVLDEIEAAISATRRRYAAELSAGVTQFAGLMKATQQHASPHCACGTNAAGERFVDPLCQQHGGEQQ